VEQNLPSPCLILPQSDGKLKPVCSVTSLQLTPSIGGKRRWQIEGWFKDLKASFWLTPFWAGDTFRCLFIVG